VILILVIGGERLSAGARHTLVVLLALSMGAQLAAIRYVKVPDLFTVALTTTITGALTERGRGWTDPAVLRRELALLTFAVGVLFGALLARYVSISAALGLGLAIIVLVAVAAHSVSRTEADWSAPRSA
jgi:uncharacterized membrane protein YoaK (UPF0700 family)